MEGVYKRFEFLAVTVCFPCVSNKLHLRQPLMTVSLLAADKCQSNQGRRR